MPSEKSEAIVLRVVEFSETSCIVTLLTRDFGKITAIAKGARRPKSPFEAALDLLAICRIVFLHKTNAMSLLTEAKLENRFRAGESNLSRLYIGYYVLELLNLLTDDGDPQPEVYDLAASMVRQLDNQPLPDAKLSVCLLQFELGLLDLLGHLPMLTRCANCGREKTVLTKIQFGLTSGGVLCQKCRRGHSNIVSVSEEAFEFLLQLAGAQIGTEADNSDNWNQPDRINEGRLKHKSWLLGVTQTDSARTEQATLSPNEVDKNSEFSEPETAEPRTSVEPLPKPAVVQEVRKLMNQYIAHLIGYPPRLHRFLFHP